MPSKHDHAHAQAAAAAGGLGLEHDAAENGDPDQHEPDAGGDVLAGADEVLPKHGHPRTARRAQSEGRTGGFLGAAGRLPVAGAHGGDAFGDLARKFDGGLLEGDVGTDDPEVMQADDGQDRAQGEEELGVVGGEIGRDHQAEGRQQQGQRPGLKELADVIKNPLDTAVSGGAGKGGRLWPHPKINSRRQGRRAAEEEGAALPIGNAAVHEHGQGEGTAQQMKVEDRKGRPPTQDVNEERAASPTAPDERHEQCAERDGGLGLEQLEIDERPPADGRRE